MTNRWGKNGNSNRLIFLGSRITADGDAAKKLKDACSVEENYDKPRLRIKKQRHQSPYSQSYGFSSSHVWSESWTVKKAECQRIDAFELWCWRRLLRVSWTAKRPKQSILKEISSEYSLEGLMLKLYLPILWPPDVKNWLIEKDPDAGKDWEQEEKGMTEDEMVGWHYWLSGHESELIPGYSEGQESLLCCSSWGRKELDVT